MARHDVDTSLPRVAPLAAEARPGDLVVARRRNYVRARPGPAVAGPMPDAARYGGLRHAVYLARPVA